MQDFLSEIFRMGAASGSTRQNRRIFGAVAPSWIFRAEFCWRNFWSGSLYRNLLALIRALVVSKLDYYNAVLQGRHDKNTAVTVTVSVRLSTSISTRS